MNLSTSSSPAQPTSSRSVPSFSATLELLKPITWFPPMWAFMCGVVSSGMPIWENIHLLIAGMILSGPLVCAMSQAINDWHDRHVDAINEPERPIPSGRLPGKWGLYVAMIWSGLSLLWAAMFGTWVIAATALGLIMAWAYSAPPFRLKQNGWAGNTAVAFCYEGLAWFTGAAIMLGAMPNSQIILMVILYSIGAHGIMTLNDFKSISGDKQMGVASLPVQLGIEGAALAASLFMTIPQIIVIALLYFWGLPYFALGVAMLLVGQIFLMFKYLGNREELVKEPKRNSALYNATGTTLYVLGMLVSAFGIGGIAAGV